MFADAKSAPTHPCVGCASEVEVNEEVLAAARFGVAAVNRERNSVYALSFVRVVRATSQVVAGVKYTITFEAAESTCRNDGHAHELADCPVAEGTRPEFHAIEVRAALGAPCAGAASPRATG